MHIPDGLLSTPVQTAGVAFSGAALFLAALRERSRATEVSPAFTGLLGAFVFAAQMVNFPVAAGTSGHFMGAFFVCYLLGPWLGVISISVVLGLQAFLFADGGLFALGVNIFNMGIVAGWGGLLLHRFLRWALPGREETPLLIGMAAWVSILLASLAAALELALSGVVPLHFGAPAMAGVHALIGLGEALITVWAITVIRRTRPDLLALGEPSPTWGEAS